MSMFTLRSRFHSSFIFGLGFVSNVICSCSLRNMVAPTQEEYQTIVGCYDNASLQVFQDSISAKVLIHIPRQSYTGSHEYGLIICVPDTGGDTLVLVEKNLFKRLHHGQRIIAKMPKIDYNISYYDIPRIYFMKEKYNILICRKNSIYFCDIYSP
ncbi:hypothetical protein GC194_15230 [bacterium]|nr:hypothetical protein [bacterium]